MHEAGIVGRLCTRTILVYEKVHRSVAIRVKLGWERMHSGIKADIDCCAVLQRVEVKRHIRTEREGRR